MRVDEKKFFYCVHQLISKTVLQCQRQHQSCSSVSNAVVQSPCMLCFPTIWGKSRLMVLRSLLGCLEGVVEHVPCCWAGIKVMCQVTTMQQITDVVAEGADAIVVQGNESGGHGASPASTLSFVPEAVDHVQQLCKSLNRPGVPVIAAGGISDARQVGPLIGP